MPEIINYQMDVLNNKTNSLIRRKNNYLIVINNLQDEFKFQSELQNEYDEIATPDIINGTIKKGTIRKLFNLYLK